MTVDLRVRLEATAVAFRGYNTTNLGRSPELLEHAAYGPYMERSLRRMEAIYAETLQRSCNLVQRLRDRQESTLATFSEDVAMIVGVELAQLEMLRELFGIDYHQCRVTLGYSLGEITALIAGGVFQPEDALPPLLVISEECALLAEQVTMGIVFSRGPALDLDAVRRLCMKISAQGNGIIAPSAYLAPNAVLLLGQLDTIDRFKEQVDVTFAFPPHVRKHAGTWPPLHTPLLWQRGVLDRAGMMMHTVPGGFTAPLPPVLSMVTGKASYNDYNARETIRDWLDHPQRLWDVVCEVLAAGVDVMLHVGPAPNLVPATFKRVADNVTQQLEGRSLNSLGLRAMSGIANRPWLNKVLSNRAMLLRAPYVVHVILEDWLLEQKPR